MTDPKPTREELEARAKELGVEFRANIGDETLAERVTQAEAAAANSSQPKAPDATPSSDLASASTGAAGPAPVLEEGEDLVVEVIGPKKGRWRAGRHFTPAPTVIPLSELSEHQKHALISDPRLLVTTRPAQQA
ncbi:hypothetical protein [Litorisediminicola beolgyonensis]|uniref:Mu-like prophage FluMu N-terminal domain-containing protein n=1 Tax=Litorisediminicola beolgyonensis TaxID=1173614 RepID=A0ABW3ZIK1_9RHOB